MGSGGNPSTYKSRLQELCHKKQWRLPEYDTQREGPDHSPHFQSTVTVQGLSFHGPPSCSSSKDAQGHAAMLAFDHFSSSTPPPSPPLPLSDSHYSGRCQLDDLSPLRDDALGRSLNSVSVGQAPTKNLSIYKSKLQELCQKKLWQLPKYETTKDGPDHMPHFQATISLCGVSFTSLSKCRTSKDAQSEAAMMAFSHFSGAVGPSSLAESDDSGNLANGVASGLEDLKKNPDNARDSTKQWLEQVDILDDGIPWKNQLQNYTQRRRLSLPSYDHVREHSMGKFRYKAKVTVAHQTFEAQQFFSTLKQAENASARLALASMHEEGNQEDNPIFYKSLLLEFIQKEGLSPAIFVTLSVGPSHISQFSSTIEVEGEKFKGESAKTKKQAEQNASKIAWTALKERKERSNSRVLPCHFEHSLPGARAFAGADDMQKPQGSSIEDRALVLQKPCQVAMSTTKGPEVLQSSSCSAQVELELKPEQRSDGSRRASSLSEHQKPAGEEAPMPSSKEASGCTTDLAGDTSLGRDGTSKPCIRRVQVHPWRPDLKIPEGMKLLPISDDKWVAIMADTKTT